MPPCIISDPATPDNEWIPAVTQAGLAIITRDNHIASRSAEIHEVIHAGARMFAITSSEQLQTWDLLSIVVAQWPRLELAAQENGPFIYSVTRTMMNKLDLEANRSGR
jgi:hypothetical protein